MKKNNDKKIGVITTVYNDSKYLFNAIAGVKSQTLDNVFHYIYDDASTDGLKDSLKELENDTTVSIVYGETNKGQSFGRNVLIEKALADGCNYIAFLDSDDFWFSQTHLEECLNSLKNNDIVYSKPNFVTENGQSTQPFNIPIPQIFIGKQLYHNNFIWISSVVCKKEVLLNNKFDSNLNSVEDWDLWIRLYEAGYKFTSKETITVQYLVRNTTQASLGNTKMSLFNVKHKRLPQLKLHLACGQTPATTQ